MVWSKFPYWIRGGVLGLIIFSVFYLIDIFFIKPFLTESFFGVKITSDFFLVDFALKILLPAILFGMICGGIYGWAKKREDKYYRGDRSKFIEMNRNLVFGNSSKFDRYFAFFCYALFIPIFIFIKYLYFLVGLPLILLGLKGLITGRLLHLEFRLYTWSFYYKGIWARIMGVVFIILGVYISIFAIDKIPNFLEAFGF